MVVATFAYLAYSSISYANCLHAPLKIQIHVSNFAIKFLKKAPQTPLQCLAIHKVTPLPVVLHQQSFISLQPRRFSIA